MIFTNCVESQLPLISVVTVSSSNGVDNFSKSGKEEIVIESVTICADSSVVSNIVANGETSVVSDFPLR